MFFILTAKLVIFLHLKTKFYCPYVVALFKNFSVVAAMLPIMAKINVILKSECGNTWEFRHSLGKELKVMMILPLKNIFIFAYHAADIEDCSFLAGNSNDFKVTSMESLRIDKDHPRTVNLYIWNI